MNLLSNKDFFDVIHSQEISKKDKIVIQNVIFNEGIHFYSFDEFNKPIIIEDCHFKMRMDISSVHFKEPVLIQKCSIQELYIGACGFHSTFDLLNNKIFNKFEVWDTSFYSLVKFHKNDFLGGSNLFSKHESYGSVEFKGGLEFY